MPDSFEGQQEYFFLLFIVGSDFNKVATDESNGCVFEKNAGDAVVGRLIRCIFGRDSRAAISESRFGFDDLDTCSLGKALWARGLIIFEIF